MSRQESKEGEAMASELSEKKIRRFAVFVFDDYYPSGGMDDFCESFDALVSALAYAESRLNCSEKWKQNDNAQIFDFDERKVVWANMKFR